MKTNKTHNTVNFAKSGLYKYIPPNSRIVITDGVKQLANKGFKLGPYVLRYLEGDHGDLCSEDKQANEDALRDGGEIFASYITPHGKIWIITDADRMVTTALLPDEY